jgi:hypothetical protein
VRVAGRVVQQDDHAIRQIADHEVGDPVRADVFPVLAPRGPVDRLQAGLHAGFVGGSREASVRRTLHGRSDAGGLEDRLDRLPEIHGRVLDLGVLGVVVAVGLDLVMARNDLLGQLRVRLHLLADQEEGAADLHLVESVEDGRRGVRVRTVVEREGDAVLCALETGQLGPELEHLAMLLEGGHLPGAVRLGRVRIRRVRLGRGRIRCVRLGRICIGRICVGRVRVRRERVRRFGFAAERLG